MRVVTVLISREHFKDHLDEAKHTIAVFIEHKEVYCHNCKDYVYDSAIEFVTNLEKNRGSVSFQFLTGHHNPQDSANAASEKPRCDEDFVYRMDSVADGLSQHQQALDPVSHSPTLAWPPGDAQSW